MKTQIVYVLISSNEDLYLEELWASLFSLRIFHPSETVKLLTDQPTAGRIKERITLSKMISELVVVDVPEHYTPKEKSRQIKTTVRNIIDGPYLFIDTDTIICKPLDEIDNLGFDIGAVPDGHLPLTEYAFRQSVYQNAERIFGDSNTDSPYWFNSGVMYVTDNERTHEFYNKWNENWVYSTFQKGYSQDQPALAKTDKDFGFMIQRIPDIYNCQIALSMKYYADAAIIHFWHMDFIADQNYSPFLGLSAYREIKEHNCIPPHVEEQILNCKLSFTSPTMVVGADQILFLFSTTGQLFCQLHQKSRLWEKVLDRIATIILRVHRGIRKIETIVKRR